MKKKILKKVISLIVLLNFLLCLSIFSVSAASSSISFSTQKPQVNEKFTVNVTVNAGENMRGVQYKLSYDPDIVKCDELPSYCNGGAGVLTIVDSYSDTTKKTHSFSFTAIAAGACTFKVSEGIYALSEEKSFDGSSWTITVSDAAKSDNADLKSLSLSKGTLSPKFSAAKTTYTASVANDVTDVKVYATAADGEAKVEVSGKSALEVGENVRTVTVTAASGAQKTYKITITRAAEGETSEPEQTPEPEVNPYEATVDGVAYTVATDISGIALPKGFSASVAEYNGAEVAVAKDADSNYTVYYLKAADGEAYAPYLLSADGASFEKLKYAQFGDKTYILAEIPEGSTAPDGYYDTFIKIGDFDVKAFASRNEELSDLYYVYCFYDGSFRMYRYDSRENVLQRAPEFKPVTESENKLPQNAGFASRFKSLSSNAKITVIGLLLAALVAVVLIVLLGVRLAKGRQSVDNYDFNEDMLFRADFDNVTVTDGGKNEAIQEESGKETDETEKQ